MYIYLYYVYIYIILYYVYVYIYIILCICIYILYTCFLKWGYLQVIHFNRMFHEINQPAIKGYAHDYGNPLGATCRRCKHCKTLSCHDLGWVFPQCIMPIIPTQQKNENCNVSTTVLLGFYEFLSFGVLLYRSI